MKNDYSTKPDELTGWKNKNKFLSPGIQQYPLIYYNPMAAQITKLLKNNKQNTLPLIIYTSKKYQSSFQIKKAAEECFLLKNTGQKKRNIVKGKRSLIRPEQLNRFMSKNNVQSVQNHTLKFDADFQSGNLDLAIKVNSFEYDLVLRVDSNTKGHTAWFYFKVSGMIPQQQYRFNIINYGRKKSLYQNGLKPYVKEETGQWVQQGKIEGISEWKSIKYENITLEKKHTQLTFSYTTSKHQSIYFAYGIPYTYSNLLNILQSFKTKYPHLIRINQEFVSSAGIQIPILSITNSHQANNKEDKEAILCIGRQHPGETQSSWILQGFIQFLLSPSGHFLRDRFKFVIIPMLNVDGVILGNFRTCLIGKDLNRNFDAFERTFETELVKKICEKKKPYIFLDFHGHSTKKNIFLYGPDYPLSNLDHITCRLFPKFIQKYSPSFKYHSCSFRLEKYKKKTARGYMHKQIEVKFSFTIEASNYGYSKDNKFVPFNVASFKESGRQIGEGLQEFARFLKNCCHKYIKKGQRTVSPLNKDHEKFIEEIKNEINVSDSEQSDKSDSDCQSKSNDYEEQFLDDLLSSPRTKNAIKLKEKVRSFKKFQSKSISQSQNTKKKSGIDSKQAYRRYPFLNLNRKQSHTEQSTLNTRKYQFVKSIQERNSFKKQREADNKRSKTLEKQQQEKKQKPANNRPLFLNDHNFRRKLSKMKTEGKIPQQDLFICISHSRKGEIKPNKSIDLNKYFLPTYQYNLDFLSQQKHPTKHSIPFHSNLDSIQVQIK